MAKRLRGGTPGGERDGADEQHAPAGALRVGRLDSLERVRREAVRLYRDCRQGSLAPGDASKLASVLDLVRRLVEAGEIEVRLTELERAVRHGASPDDPTLAIARRLRAARAAG